MTVEGSTRLDGLMIVTRMKGTKSEQHAVRGWKQAHFIPWAGRKSTSRSVTIFRPRQLSTC